MKYEFNEKEHLHLLGDKPLTGTSTVMDVLYKPLSWYASGKACEKFGWRNPKFTPKEEIKKAADAGLLKIRSIESVADYIKFLDEAYRNHDTYKNSRAGVGVDLHAELERYVKWKLRGAQGIGVFGDKVKEFIEWADKNVKKFIASEANCYSEKLWVGGITDCVAEMNDGTLAIIDFKSAKAAYNSHFLQTAGYAIQIEENGMWDTTGTHNKKLDNKVQTLIVVPFGADVIKPEIRQHQLVESYKHGFEKAVELYRILELDKVNK